MEIKKGVKPMKKAKKRFVKRLKKKKIESVSIYTDYEGKDYDYYVNVSGSSNSDYYNACFTIHEGQESIAYRDKSHHYNDLSIFEFLQIITIFDE